MSQTFPAITAATTLSNSLVPIIERDQANKTQFSGTAFPSADLEVGMPCYRTDQGKLYVLTATSPAVNWSQVLQQTEADARYLQLTGGTVSGTLSFGSTARQMLNLFSTTYAVGVQTNTSYVRTASRFSVFQGGAHSATENAPGTGGAVLFTVAPTAIQYLGNTVWHAGNDGASSGLDADLLDGLQATAFVRSVNGLTPDASGAITLSNTTFNGTTITFSGTMTGPSSFVVDTVTTGVYNTTPLATYSRTRAHTFRTVAAGTTGTLAIEGAAIDGSATILIGKGVAGGNIARDVDMGASLTVTGDVTSGASDHRLKTNFEPVLGALDKVDQLGAWYFTFNKTAEEIGITKDLDQRRVGLIAQEVQAVLPEAVFPAPADPRYLTVQYEKLVPLLVAAIRELRAELKEMQK